MTSTQPRGPHSLIPTNRTVATPGEKAASQLPHLRTAAGAVAGPVADRWPAPPGRAARRALRHPAQVHLAHRQEWPCPGVSPPQLVEAVAHGVTASRRCGRGSPGMGPATASQLSPGSLGSLWWALRHGAGGGSAARLRHWPTTWSSCPLRALRQPAAACRSTIFRSIEREVIVIIGQPVDSHSSSSAKDWIFSTVTRGTLWGLSRCTHVCSAPSQTAASALPVPHAELWRRTARGPKGEGAGAGTGTEQREVMPGQWANWRMSPVSSMTRPPHPRLGEPDSGCACRDGQRAPNSARTRAGGHCAARGRKADTARADRTGAPTLSAASTPAGRSPTCGSER